MQGILFHFMPLREDFPRIALKLLIGLFAPPLVSVYLLDKYV